MPAGPRPAPPDDTVRVIIKGTVLGHLWAAIQWLQLSASSRSQADLNNVLASFGAAFATRYGPSMGTATTVTNYEGIWLTPGGGEILGTYGTGFTGTNSSGVQLGDAAACYVISEHISAYYRGGHPRLYLPGLVGPEVTNGSDLSGTRITTLAAAALAFINDVNALSHGGITAVTLGTVSFAHANAWRSPPIFRPFVGTSVNPKIGNQRRRIHS